MATDQDILRHIGELVAVEDQLRSHEGRLEPEDLERLRAVEVALDQCWDLLRQRRARREFGQEVDSAEHGSRTSLSITTSSALLFCRLPGRVVLSGIALMSGSSIIAAA